MVITLGFFLYSILGLCITYALKMKSFIQLTAVCRQENIRVENFMYNSSDKVLSQADIMLKHADMFECFKILTKLALVGVLIFGVESFF